MRVLSSRRDSLRKLSCSGVNTPAGRKGADKIQLDKTVLKNFADVLAHATETRSGDLIIKYGADTITLDNVAKIGLHSGDFLFV